MQCRISVVTLTAWLILISNSNTNAADSAQNASGASTHASKAITMGIAASGQVTLGVSAVPLLSAGAVSSAIGAASTAAGKSSAATGSLPENGPLPITDETITVMPPTEALRQRPQTTPR